MDEDNEEKIHTGYCHHSKSYPSLPANYVSILDLKERWLKQKQARDSPVHREPAQASRVKKEEPDVSEKSGEQMDEAKEIFKAKKKRKKKKPKRHEDVKEVQKKLEDLCVSERVDEGKAKEEAVTVRVSRKKNVGGGRELKGTSVKEGEIVDADKKKDVTFGISRKEDDNFNGHNGRFREKWNGRFEGNQRFGERRNGGSAGNGRMQNSMVWVKKGESATSSSNGNYLQEMVTRRNRRGSGSVVETEWRVK